MKLDSIINIARELDTAGLLWQPEIGDEVSARENPDKISILVDPDGLTPSKLRQTYVWLPTVEQMIFQFEARQAILYHAGLELQEQTYCYKTVVKTQLGHIEARALSLRNSLGIALRDLLLTRNKDCVH